MRLGRRNGLWAGRKLQEAREAHQAAVIWTLQEFLRHVTLTPNWQ